ncbi:MAG: hypothetical protein HYU86_08880 [Chloroflexi bacterium]|nr:hypothetical protein [Chloroflexota bacterium]
MSVDLVVKNGTVVAPDFSYEANVVIHGGKFAAITRRHPHTVERTQALFLLRQDEGSGL